MNKAAVAGGKRFIATTPVSPYSRAGSEVGLSAESMDSRRGTEVVFRHEGALNPGHHGHWLWSVIPIK